MGWSSDPLVRVFNRVRDDETGAVVPYEAYYDGQVYVIQEHVDVPWGVARIIVHRSMYKIDPTTSQGSYRLGCQEFGIPVDPLPASETRRTELYDRDLAPSGQGSSTIRPTPLINPIRRLTPVHLVVPSAEGEGAFPGTFLKPTA